MRFYISCILLPLLFAALGMAQTIRPIRERIPVGPKFEFGASIGYSPWSEYSTLKYYTDNTLKMRVHSYSFEIPARVEFTTLFPIEISASAGVKKVSFTPKTKTRKSSYATSTTTFPLGRLYGYVDSYWGTGSIGLSMPLWWSSIRLGIGANIDCFLHANKGNDTEHFFLSIGPNSFARLVPTLFGEVSVVSYNTRMGVRLGAQYGGHLDGERLFYTMRIKQASFDECQFSLSLFLTYRVFTTYAKHKYQLF